MRASKLSDTVRAEHAGVGNAAVLSSQRMKDAKVTPTDIDIYFSADVETDGPIPGPFSMLALALVKAGSFDGTCFVPSDLSSQVFYAELRPISEQYEAEALAVNGLDRDRLLREGGDPREVMTEAADWIRSRSVGGFPVLVAYPLSFDWLWLYWYFVRFSRTGSPFNHSRCFDVKTAFAVKDRRPISRSGRKELRRVLGNIERPHTHKAVDDAREQAEIFARLFSWKEKN
jgi:hypothetical protein